VVFFQRHAVGRTDVHGQDKGAAGVSFRRRVETWSRLLGSVFVARRIDPQTHHQDRDQDVLGRH
jgi:hypothetical protein